MKVSTKNIIKAFITCWGIALAVIFSYGFLRLCFVEQISVAIVLGFVGTVLALSIILRDE